MRKNKISKSWIINQYFKSAKSSGFRSRSAYKLLELNEKFNFFKNSKTIIDLGSYPGGWSQIIKKNIKNCRILSVDLKKMENIQGVEFVHCDFQKQESKKKIANILGVKVDAVISDMAANTTGNKDLDCIRTNENGVVIAKLFNGKDFLDVKRLAEKTFRKVNFFKPESSRDNSKETYIHCKGIKTL